MNRVAKNELGKYKIGTDLDCLVGSRADDVVPQRLAAKDLDDWEQKRVKRLKGEHDGVL